MKKLIVITGASSGFGALTAKLFDDAGYHTLLLARRANKIKELSLKNAIIKKIDVTDFESFNKAVKDAEKLVGPVDLLVNNAGVMLLGIMGKQKLSDYDKMIDINIKGLINGIETIINGMRKRKHGTIINIASTAGLKAYDLHAVYCGTKAAVCNLSETLRQEVALDNVRVTSLCPGAFQTELLEHTKNNDIVDRYFKWQKEIAPMAQSIEVAKMIKYIYESPQELAFREVVMHSTKQVN